MTTTVRHRRCLYLGTAVSACLCLFLGSPQARAAPQSQHVELRGDVVLYLPFDGSLHANLPTVDIGLAPSPTAKMEMAGTPPKPTLGPGVRGQAVFVDKTFGPYLHEVLNSNEVGTVMCWTKHDWTASTDESHTLFHIGVKLPTLGSLFRYRNQPYWQWVAWYHHIDQRHTYGPTASLSSIKAGQWYHVAATWSYPERIRRVYINGKLMGELPIKRPLGRAGGLWVGTAVYGAHALNGWVDELYVLNEPLTPSAVEKAYRAGQEGQQAYAIGPPPPTEKLDVLPSDSAPPPPEWVRWDFDGVDQRSNLHRANVPLHSWWRWQPCEKETEPPNTGEWKYRKVPSGDGRGERFYVFDTEKRPLKDIHPDKGKSWYEREFRVPERWTGRRIELDIDEISGRSAVYMGGALLTEIPSANAGTTIDITDHVTPGASTTLTVRTKGLVGNIRLRSAPKTARIVSSHLTTSVRRSEVTMACRVTGSGSNTLTMAGEIFADADGGQSVLRLGPIPLIEDAGQAIAPLPKEARLWSLEQPALYWYRVELLDAGGSVVDRTLSRRFGFREFWIEKDRFILNGAPIHLYGHSHPHFMTTAETGMPGFADYMIRRWKEAGLNATYNWAHRRSLGRVFDAADEIGFLFVPKILPSPAAGSEHTEAYMAGYRSLLQRTIDKHCDHPSIAAWMVNPGGSHVWDFCPATLDNSYQPEALSFTKSLVAQLRRSRDEVRRLDPSRIGFHHSSGNEGPVHGSMAYMTFDVDLRERANWPRAWSAVRHKPILVCEWGLPMSSAWYARTQVARRRYPHHKAIPLYTQYAAMYAGPEAYSWESEDMLKRLSRPGGWGAFKTCGTVVRLKTLFAEENIRAWRTYGISFFFHAEVPSFFAGETPKPDLTRDPRFGGAVPDYIPAHISAVWQSAAGLSPLGKAVKELLSPVHAYIGGPDGDFTNTDHTFLPGETVRKELIVINDRPHAVELSAEWEATEQGRRIAGGKLGGTIQAGRREIDMFPIAFSLPPVAETRRDVEIAVTWQADGPETKTTTFGVTVLPTTTSPTRGGRAVLLFDPAGETRKVLRTNGVATQDMNGTPDSDTLLVVGRRALSEKNGIAALVEAGLDKAVRRGLNVLVFEQSPGDWEGTIMGLRLRETSTRYAFVRAEAHPILKKITDDDLHHWRGNSDLIEAYPGPGTPPKSTYDYPLHFWHWGNDNVVATYVIEKPQTGAARSLIECGFDLSETPLLEVAIGKGRIVFCQLDVTNRYGSDPVATRIVDNSLTYLRTAESPSPMSVNWHELSRSACKGSKPADLYRRAPPEGPASWGIGPGDVFFRKATRVPAHDGPAPLFRTAQADGRSFLVCTLTTADLDDDWIRGKAARIAAALRINAGFSAPEGPALENPPSLYPIEWRRVERLDGPFDPYLYWRW
ncbi:MAG: hypothetical protein HN742_39750 [Lentisphaerae bacterium]|jgi:beta-galactosidase|nr:hypothetical protein [Lentisphaerota bacterium]MBT4814250.1 hypothetical protein [Lentisphaerota bacterium]MBT5610974.1 hypothetical protein [Lentisphaerota bacterium]MBT7058057.1 hypothetical protein [Lentisphaerota bacterium]MBT7848070.1 hypothetical protein [Lentisphaerota bacterium]